MDSQALAAFIDHWGAWTYAALALGCLLEGETALLLAGFAAHQHHLDPLAVLAVASCAAFAGDQGFFWLGRRHGAALVARWPSLGRRTERLNRLTERWRGAVVVLVRFAYGLRVAGPVLIGMSPMPAWQFAAFNAVGALLWAAVVGSLGWLFGRAAHVLLGHIRHIEGWLLLALAAAGALYWLQRQWRARRE